MKLIQITGAQGGDTILMIVPNDCAVSDVMEVLSELDGEVELRGPAVREAEVQLPDELDVDLFTVFVQVE